MNIRLAWRTLPSSWPKQHTGLSFHLLCTGCPIALPSLLSQAAIMTNSSLHLLLYTYVLLVLKSLSALHLSVNWFFSWVIVSCILRAWYSAALLVTAHKHTPQHFVNRFQTLQILTLTGVLNLVSFIIHVSCGARSSYLQSFYTDC